MRRGPGAGSTRRCCALRRACAVSRRCAPPLRAAADSEGAAAGHPWRLGATRWAGSAARAPLSEARAGTGRPPRVRNQRRVWRERERGGEGGGEAKRPVSLSRPTTGSRVPAADGCPAARKARVWRQHTPHFAAARPRGHSWPAACGGSSAGEGCPLTSAGELDEGRGHPADDPEGLQACSVPRPGLLPRPAAAATGSALARRPLRSRPAGVNDMLPPAPCGLGLMLSTN